MRELIDLIRTRYTLFGRDTRCIHPPRRSHHQNPSHTRNFQPKIGHQRQISASNKCLRRGPESLSDGAARRQHIGDHVSSPHSRGFLLEFYTFKLLLQYFLGSCRADRAHLAIGILRRLRSLGSIFHRRTIRYKLSPRK